MQSVATKAPQAEILPRGSEDILTLDELMIRHIQYALSLTNGKIYGVDGAAKKLGINPNTLRGRMRKFSIPFGTKE